MIECQQSTDAVAAPQKLEPPFSPLSLDLLRSAEDVGGRERAEREKDVEREGAGARRTGPAGKPALREAPKTLLEVLESSSFHALRHTPRATPMSSVSASISSKDAEDSHPANTQASNISGRGASQLAVAQAKKEKALREEAKVKLARSLRNLLPVSSHVSRMSAYVSHMSLNRP